MLLRSSSKRVLQKTAEATDDLIGNKITNKIVKLSKNSQQNNLETVRNENDKKIAKKDMYLQKKDKQFLIT